MRKLLVLVTLVATAGLTAVAGVGAPVGATPASDKKFCNVNWKISELFNTVSEDASPAEIEKVQTKLDALLDDGLAVVPEAIEPQVTAAATSLRQGIEQAFQDPTLAQYGSEIDAWVADNCGYQVVDAHATEYHFSGIPKKLKPGKTIFRLTNDGAELHELGIGRIKTKTPLKQLIADEERANKEVAQLGGTFALQGEESYAYVVLKKGRHAAVCFVPVGATDPNTEPPEGPPHAAEGMVAEFRVV